MLSKSPPSSMSPTLRQRAPKAPCSSTSTSTPARSPSSSASPMFAISSGPDAQTPLLPTQSRSPAKPDARLIEPHPSLSHRPGTRLSGEGSEGREGPGPGQDQGKGDMENLSSKSQWIVLAIASGGCAAFNGVFAKLTTTELTTSFATWVANLVGLANVEGGVEVIVRALFFALNLVFNGIMWTLFTKALARGTSTTQVSILNTSANFMLTAVLGWVIFSESLPPLWFLGAALLVAGNVIIGRREEGEEKEQDVERERRRERGEERSSEEGEGLLGEELELDDEEERKRKREEEEDVVELGLDDGHAGRERGLI